MKIGISTSVKTKEENWQRMLRFINDGVTNIEINNSFTRIRRSDIEPLLKLKKEKNLSLSFHSMCQDLFCDDEVIARGEYYSLLAEIKLASDIKCNNLIFHISKKDELNEKEINDLKELVKYSKQVGVKLCLENNSSPGVFSSDYIVEILKKVDDLYFCLDIGHFNVSVEKGYIKNSDNFISKIRGRLIELHIHFNNGKEDQHLGYSQKYESYLRNILKKTDGFNKRLIIEARNYKQALKTYSFLEKYH